MLGLLLIPTNYHTDICHLDTGCSLLCFSLKSLLDLLQCLNRTHAHAHTRTHTQSSTLTLAIQLYCDNRTITMATYYPRHYRTRNFC